MTQDGTSEQPGRTETVSLWDETPSQKPFLLALLLFSLACRLILIQFKDVVGTDEVIYLALGKNLWHGLGFRLMDQPITLCPPLLPMVAGFFSLFTEHLDENTAEWLEFARTELFDLRNDILEIMRELRSKPNK